MITTKDLITQALKNIGVVASGETPDAHDINDSYQILRQMMDSWSLEKLLVPGVVHDSFDINAIGAFNTYTIGDGGQLNVARPLDIVSCRVSLGAETDHIVDPKGVSHWAQKDYKTSVSIPSFFYYEKTYPLGKIYFDAIIPTEYRLKLVSWKEIGALPALDDLLAYPPGYERAIRLNLEVELAPAFEKEVNQTTARYASMQKKQIKSANRTPLNSRVDSGLLKGKRGYDINSGP